jgi:hypothetical protein
MRKIVLTFGLIAGAILSVVMAATIPFYDRIGYDQSMVIGYTSMVLAFMLIYFGVRSYRDNVAGGTVGFGRAFGVGMLIASVAALCYVATWEVIYFNFAPDFMTKMQAHTIEKARADGESPAQIAARQAELTEFAEMYRNPAINSAITFMEPMPVALIVSLVTAGVLSRRRKEDAGELGILSDMPRSAG